MLVPLDINHKTCQKGKSQTGRLSVYLVVSRSSLSSKYIFLHEAIRLTLARFFDLKAINLYDVLLRISHLQGIEYRKKIFKYYRVIVNSEKTKYPRQAQDGKKGDKGFRQRPLNIE